ncbi:hypothetical protein [Halorubrum sp. C191]|uniref:hypothetical protein n=1 Tax=Halorubrum sp. C191 TaxID=1383842 RepID=UPI001181AF31|nr:hypothetical protein [Halorubrum sp. C191]
MSKEQVPTDTSNEDLLLEDEISRLEWYGKVKKSENSYYADFIITDDRLILSQGEGHFMDIGLEHIESVESSKNVETRTETTGTDASGVFAISAVLILGGIGWIAALSSAIGFVIGAILIVPGILVFSHALSNHSDMESTTETNEYVTFELVLRTSSQSPLSEALHIQTRDDVGVALSKIVQKAS